MAPTFAPELLDLLESLTVERWSGSVWREVLGDTDPLRPNQRRARWNPPGVEALYCSLLAVTSAAEVDFLISLQPVPVRKRRSVQLDVSLTGVVDLTDLSLVAAFGVEAPQLLGPDVEAPRMIGSAVSWLGCAGLLVPSARHSGTNLVLYTNKLAPLDHLEVASG